MYYREAVRDRFTFQNTSAEDGLSFRRHSIDGAAVLLKICHEKVHILLSLLVLLVNAQLD